MLITMMSIIHVLVYVKFVERAMIFVGSVKDGTAGVNIHVVAIAGSVRKHIHNVRSVIQDIVQIGHAIIMIHIQLIIVVTVGTHSQCVVVVR